MATKMHKLYRSQFLLLRYFFTLFKKMFQKKNEKLTSLRIANWSRNGGMLTKRKKKQKNKKRGKSLGSPFKTMN